MRFGNELCPSIDIWITLFWTSKINTEIKVSTKKENTWSKYIPRSHMWITYCFPEFVFYSYFFFLGSIRSAAYNFEAILHLCGWVSRKPLIKCRREQYSMNLLCINLMTRIKLAGSILKPCLTHNASAVWDSLHFSAWLIKVCSYLLKLQLHSAMTGVL